MFARHLFLALAAASLLLAGCGGGSEQAASLSAEKFAAVKQHADAHAASVTPAQAAEQLLNAAESAYPGYFTGHKQTQSYGAFAFRFYPETNMYLGVAIVAGLGYTQNGIYVVGTGFGTLANPAYQGVVTNFLPGLVIDSGLGGNKTLTVTVTVQGFSSTIQVGSVPAPTTEVDFCSGLTSDTTFTSIGEQGGGSLTINSCSFNGTSGSISATLTYVIPGYPSQVIPYTIMYSYS
ncbi:hypothetical protein [Caenimonas aquaedulcis]|uniref:Lipoprotein n=1 Tax=Caenimonas aquaedulcis TaxID=2793270 RepID=A0A931MH41_9BURK|nr:hypothetical protein [Caenimonas aquaedulcis]MBG9388399.1 hypothetical protein [Caenimonas aquaedulcis]